MPKTNAEVANKVRTEMTKEKLLKQFKDWKKENSGGWKEFKKSFLNLTITYF